MRVSIRTALLLAVCGLVLGVAGVSGGYGDLHTGRAADQLGAEITNQTAVRVGDRVAALTNSARAEAAAAARVVATRPPNGHREALVGRWRDSLAVNPNLASCFAGFEATGEAIGVTRVSGPLAVWDLSAGPRPGAYRLREFPAEDFPHTPRSDRPDFMYDVRGRPWYTAAKAAGGPIWTDVYPFTGEGLSVGVPGVTYAVPVRAPGGNLRAVVTTDFLLTGLNDYLSRVEVGRNGYAVLIETGSDGRHRVIAHPRPEALRGVSDGGASGRTATLGDSSDPVLRAAESAFTTAAVDAPGAFRVGSDGETFLAVARPVGGADGPPWRVLVLLPERDVIGVVRAARRSAVVVGLAAVAVAIILGIGFARRLSRPLERLAGQLSAMGRLEFPAEPVRGGAIREVADLATSAETMKAGLRSFARFVPTDLVRSLLRPGAVAEVGAERRELTVLFTDIADFTTVSEGMPGEDLALHLSDYLSVVSGAVAAAGGTVDKYIGDSVMAFWNAPAEDPGHAANACRAAVAVQRALADARARWAADGKPPLRTRVGVHTGVAIVGNFGSVARLNYTAVGDTVNLASRLEGLNKECGTEILVSEATYRAAGGVAVGRLIGPRHVKGRAAEVVVYELLRVKGEADPA